MSLKSKLGYLKRGFAGAWHNLVEPAPAWPDLPKIIIGRSVQGRDIVCYKLGNGATPLLFVCGIHGNEVGTVKLAGHLLEWLERTAAKFPRFTFFIIPSLNPDGYAQARRRPDYWRGGRTGRFNGRGVDLNRNFPTPSFQSRSVWSRGKNYSETEEVFCGESGNSEPETQSLTGFIKTNNIKFYFAFHNAAADVMGNDNAAAQNLAQAFAAASGYRFVGAQEWQELRQTGTAKEWCDLESIAYVEAEGRYRWGSDWTNQKAGIAAVLQKL